MNLLRRLATWAMLISFSVCIADFFDLLPLTSGVSGYLWAVYFIFWGIDILMNWRSREGPELDEPQPAFGAVVVIVATGAVAGLMIVPKTQSASGYAVIAAIVVVTAILAVTAFRFASKNRDHIGEARFDTMKDH